MSLKLSGNCPAIENASRGDALLNTRWTAFSLLFGNICTLYVYSSSEYYVSQLTWCSVALCVNDDIIVSS